MIFAVQAALSAAGIEPEGSAIPWALPYGECLPRAMIFAVQASLSAAGIELRGSCLTADGDIGGYQVMGGYQDIGRYRDICGSYGSRRRPRRRNILT